MGGSVGVEGEVSEETLSRLFEVQAGLTPDAVALIEGERQLSYGELEVAANRLAHHLIGCGIGPERLVGVVLDRSVEMIVALLAVAKAGGAYLPLSPDEPEARLRAMLADADPVCLLTNRERAGKWAGDIPLLRLDDPALAMLFAGQPETAPTDGDRLAPFGPHNLAYVIYTSGSTGTPKGVMTTQANVASLAWRPSYVPIEPGQTLLQFAPLAFDAATFEIWGALLNGARLVLAPSGPPDLDRLCETVTRHRIDTMWLTASLFGQIVESHPHMFKGVRWLIAGGEALPVAAVDRILALHPKLSLVNGYGPTETTTFACTHAVTTQDARGERIAIGAAIRNVQAYVLDTALAPVPAGVVGELHIAGAGVARGYLNHPELTAERFAACPFGPPGTRMYRTGDLVRRRADGLLDFLGRSDQQIKIRGFRIEPDEINGALTAIEGVGQAAVVARQLAGETRLCAYLVARPGQILPDRLALREALAARLPGYMIPASFTPLEALPLTANGKLDQNALPEPNPERRDRLAKTCGSTAGPSRLDNLIQIFGRILDIDTPDPTVSFFQLGGHSLSGLRLVFEIERVLHKKISLGMLYSAPSIEQLAHALDLSEAVPKISLVRLHEQQVGDPIFIVDSAPRDLAYQLRKIGPVYALSFGLANGIGYQGDTFPQSVEEFATHYINEIRAVQPNGPYHLIGYSFGGLIAYEMAQQLSAQNQDIALLSLLDTSGPSTISGQRLFPWNVLLLNVINASPLDLWQQTQQYIRRRLRPLMRLMPSIWPGPTALESWRSQFELHQSLRVKYSKTYVIRPYAGRVQFFKSRRITLIHRQDPPPELEWLGFVRGGIEIHQIPGEHHEMVNNPFAGVIAEKIADQLGISRNISHR